MWGGARQQAVCSSVARRRSDSRRRRRAAQVTPENFDQFKKRWSELDPAGVGFINVAEVGTAISWL